MSASTPAAGPLRANGYLPIAGYGLVGDCRSVAPVGVDSNILQTILETADGQAEVTDGMPVRDHTIREHARPQDRPRLIRVVTGLAGRVRFRQSVICGPITPELTTPCGRRTAGLRTTAPATAA
jgi:hypothetical protein